MHTWIKEVNGQKIYHWTLGDVYYIEASGEWIYKDKSLSAVEEFAKQLKR
ncbi:hypothetical protein [Paenibacillus elgii]|nr:hypothetical protein [Paenibacillus elgii]